MNPFCHKSVNFQTSIPVKLNPEDKTFKIIKQAAGFNRQFSFKAKNVDLPQNQSTLQTASLQKEEQKFLASKNMTTKLFKNASENEKDKKPSVFPYNPFEHLTESSMKRRYQSPVKSQEKLKQAESLIEQLSNQNDKLNQQLSSIKEIKLNIQKQLTQKVTHLNTELTQLKSQISLLKSEKAELLNQFKFLSEKNNQLQLAIDQLQKKQYHHSHNLNDENDSQKYRLLGKQYEKRINDLYEENYKLKNSYSLIEAKFQQNQAILQSSRKMNDMLEKRFVNYEQQNSIMKEQLRVENQQIKRQCLALREEKELRQSQGQVEILRLENQIYELRKELELNDKDCEKAACIQSRNRNIQQQSISTLQIALKQQIDETIRLREKNKKLAKMFNQYF